MVEEIVKQIIKQIILVIKLNNQEGKFIQDYEVENIIKNGKKYI